MENKNNLDDIKIQNTFLEASAEQERMINVIYAALTLAGKFNLEAQVILSSLQTLKRHPNISIEDAIHAGLEDWDL